MNADSTEEESGICGKPPILKYGGGSPGGMWNKSNLTDPVLINTIGHTAGLLLFGLTIGLLIRDWRSNGVRQTRLSVIAAGLALAWNAGSLLALGSSDELLIRVVMTLSFSVLSMLPAILLQVALHGEQRLIVACGYLVSLTAIVLHVSEFFSGGLLLHQAALITVAAGFGALTVIAFLFRHGFRLSNPPGRADWLTLPCLLLFAASFLHFGYGHVGSPWTGEIAWHHLGIPVALIVLLQDYRFLLLDTFVRFVSNALLAVAYVAALLALNRRFDVSEAFGSNMFLTGLLLVALCLSLVLFAYFRNGMQAWLSRVIFRRTPVDQTVNRILAASTLAQSEEELLSRATGEIARHLGTELSEVLPGEALSSHPDQPTILAADLDAKEFRDKRFWAEAQIPLHLSNSETRFLVFGARRGGRRYLSEDLEEMRGLAAVVTGQIERFRADELKRLVSQAELRALQAQINPHFLFNAFNTLYGIIDRGSLDARRMVLNLADVFRYFLQGDRGFIPLAEELRIIEAYLEIEALRLGERLQTEITVPESARTTLIPILSIQPLVENAVKHGIANKQAGGRVHLKIEETRAGLRVAVADTGDGFPTTHQAARVGLGVGLANVRRRLTLCYGPAGELHIESNGNGALVWFLVPARKAAAAGESPDRASVASVHSV
jgi:two-component system, LytTR family, sensor kinase